jgi:hypothetical protein
MPNFDEAHFRNQVQRSLNVVKRILDVNRKPLFAADVQHQYQDKYILAEMISNMVLASTLSSFANFGVSDDKMQTIMGWAACRSVSFSFKSTEQCSFVRKTTRDVDSSTKHVTEGFGMNQTSKIVTTITEYIWKFDVFWEITCYCGTGESAEDVLSVCSKNGSTQIKTSVESAPKPEVVVRKAIDVAITSLLRNSRDSDISRQPFSIARDAPSCHTPRRNSEVEGLIQTLNNLSIWCTQVHSYFTSTLFPVEQEHGLDLGAINCSEVFVPVVPLMNDTSGATASAPAILSSEDAEGQSRGARVRRMGSQDLTTTTSLPAAGLAVAVARAPEVVLGVNDISAFLAEESRSLRAKCEQMDSVFPSRTATAAVITAAEGALLVTLLHMMEVCSRYVQGVDYIENMLRVQLVAAIGKEVKPSDFSAYMRFHNNKVFLPQYRPKPFCCAVRRSEAHAPEGVVSIEEQPTDGSIAEPIYTVASSSPQLPGMKFPLGAAAEVTFGGDRYLHAYLMHKFSNEVGMASLPPLLTLRAEARQFSSYIVLIGRISSATSFDPKYAMIVQNKDDVSIPLDLETIPSTKEFKDAISSLSPEQQRFAKTFRGMQLESTLFGVLVIQIKPQLEKVLNLPADSLTKEIRLTQDLMELFIKYQIPSDLMSFEGEAMSSVKEKLDTVKGHVASLRSIIDDAKDNEIADANLQTRYDGGDVSGGGFGASRGADGFGAKPGFGFGASRSSVGFGPKSGAGGGGGGVGFGAKSGTGFGASGGADGFGAKPGTGFGASRSSVGFGAKSGAGGGGGGVGFGAKSGGVGAGGDGFGNAGAKTGRGGDGLMTVVSAAPVFSAATPAPPPPSQRQQQQGSPCSQSAQEQPIPTPRPRGEKRPIEEHTSSEGSSDVIDYTRLPKQLDNKLEALDKEGSVRPTIITAGERWTKKAKKNLLSDVTTSTLQSEEQRSERTAAFDLLDALSKSGGICVDHAELHVVVAATHCFDRSIMDTLVQKNVNPIEKVELSTMIMATAIHNQPVERLVVADQLSRVLEFSPVLMVADAEDGEEQKSSKS